MTVQQDKSNMNYICRGIEQGFKVMLHTPDEVPRLSNGFFVANLGREISVKVKPKVILTEDTLRGYEPKRRTCYYNNERSLKFSKFYTQSNCELECLADFTLKRCGCVGFAMLRDESTRICNRTQIECMKLAEKQKNRQEYRESLNLKSSDETACNCLPLCTSIAYDHEVTENPFEIGQFYKAFDLNSNEIEGFELSMLTISFKEEEIFTLVRSEFFGFADFLANIGGLLGELYFKKVPLSLLILCFLFHRHVLGSLFVVNDRNILFLARKAKNMNCHFIAQIR